MQSRDKIKFSEAKYIRSTQRKASEKKRLSKVQRIVSTAIVLLSCAFLILGGIQVVSANTSAYQIRLEDQVLATLSSEDQTIAVIERYLADKSAEMGLDIVSAEYLRVEKVSSRDAVYTSENDAYTILTAQVPVLAQAVAVCINGEPLMYVSEKDIAMQAIDNIKAFYQGEDSATISSVTVMEEVGLLSTTVAPDQVLDLDQATNMLIYGQMAEDYHYVMAENETIVDVAVTNDLTVEQLLSLNPDFTAEQQLKIGDVLSLNLPEPLLNVQIKRTVAIEEEIPFETEQRDNYSMSRGEEEVVTVGQPGKAVDTVEIVEVNGEIIAENTVERVIVSEPVTQVVERGAMVVAASRAYTGSLGSGLVAWPYHGVITSLFGPRGMGFHSGIDIGGAVGDAIVSAGDGVVISAQNDGGYGLCVVIDHGIVGGDRLVTLYAHLSGMFVNPGQTVSKGETIGALGNTGNSTGPHLHFEVQLNGIAYDPLAFLDTSINMTFGN